MRQFDTRDRGLRISKDLECLHRADALLDAPMVALNPIRQTLRRTNLRPFQILRLLQLLNRRVIGLFLIQGDFRGTSPRSTRSYAHA